jgi:hypothetical protein
MQLMNKWRPIMNLSDNDLELFLQIYDKAIKYIPSKVKEDFAQDFIFVLGDYGIDLKRNATEIGEHEEHLDKAIEHHFSDNDEFDSDDEYAEEYWDDED